MKKEGKDEYCAKRTLSFIVLLFGLLINLTVLSGLVQAQQSEQEAVECIEENTLTALTYGGFTATCEIDDVTDVDRFNFDGVAGENIRIKVIELGNTMEPHLEVRDPNGGIVLDTWEHDRIERDLELTTSGEYLITVSDINSDQVGNYMVSIDRFPPTFDPIQLISDNSLDDEIDPNTDTDFFTFEGFEGDNIRIKVIELGNTMEPHLEVRDPNGGIVLDTWEYDRIERDLELTTSGEYLIMVSDINSDQIGNYQVAYQCLFGDCLGSIPSCLYSISPTSKSFGSSGGTDSVTVTDTNNCGWTAVSNDTDWITIDSTGQATVSYTVAVNTGVTSRAGTITIAGKTFTVTQSGTETGTELTLDIKANNSDGPITINTSETLSVVISLSANDNAGQAADWWVVASTPSGLQSYDLSQGFIPGLSVTYQGAVFNLGSATVLTTSGLAAGAYTYYFGIDLDQDGELDMDPGVFYYDSVVVNVQ